MRSSWYSLARAVVSSTACFASSSLPCSYRRSSSAGRPAGAGGRGPDGGDPHEQPPGRDPKEVHGRHGLRGAALVGCLPQDLLPAQPRLVLYQVLGYDAPLLQQAEKPGQGLAGIHRVRQDALPPGQACGGCVETDGRPFGGPCMVAACCRGRGQARCGECAGSACGLRAQLIAEFNALGIADMERVTELNALRGAAPSGWIASMSAACPAIRISGEAGRPGRRPFFQAPGDDLKGRLL